jgi:hypothetical protein
MFKAIEAVNIDNDESNTTIFLAGGITSCPDWQAELIEKIRSKYGYLDITLLNPRRKNFPIHDPNASEEQIKWEYDHLKKSDIIIFWFSEGSLNPIVLYELGMWGNSGTRKIIVGCDPNYQRIQDVAIQTKLARPDITVLDSLDAIVDELRDLL